MEIVDIKQDAFKFPEEDIPERMKFLLEPKRTPKVDRVITIEEKRAIIDAYADDRGIGEVAKLLGFTEEEVESVLFGSKEKKKRKPKKRTRAQKNKRRKREKKERIITNEAKFMGII